MLTLTNLMPRNSRQAWSPMLLEESPAFKDEHRTAAGIANCVVNLIRDAHIERSRRDGTQPGDAGEGATVCWMNDD